MDRGEGGLTVAVEARRSVRRNHVREYSSALWDIAGGGKHHGRNKNDAETDCAAQFPDHFHPPVASSCCFSMEII
jgi:hypothetical protein